MNCTGEVVIATNNGDIGGGEVMLLALAGQLKKLGLGVRVVAPTAPSALGERAQHEGYKTHLLPASSRRQYMWELRRWRREHPNVVLWCNGLVPSLATAGMRRRIVHLHQLPVGLHTLLLRVARFRALTTVVPSEFVGQKVKGSLVLDNWVDALPVQQLRTNDGVTRLGFLGRLSLEKGVNVLATALAQLDSEDPGRYRLVIAGEARFIGARERAAVEAALAPVSHLVDRRGWTPPADFFDSIDLLVCPSVTPEAFGLVVAEAMSARVPFVTSDAGALGEVAGGEYPWVVPAGDPARLAAAVRGATNNPRVEVTDRAYERWKRVYSPDSGTHRLRQLLSQLGLMSTTWEVG